MITLVNDCTLITAGGWSQGQATHTQKAYDIKTAEALDGSQDRQSNRSKPLQKHTVSFRVIDLDNRLELTEQIRDALKRGRAAMPFWGRGQYILTEITGTTLETDPEGAAFSFTAGQKVFLFNPANGEFEVAEIAAVTDTNNYTLTGAPSKTFRPGTVAYPLIFGKPSIESGTLIDPHAGDFTLSVSEPLGSGDLLDSEIDCPIVVESFAGENLTFCENFFELALVPKCGGFTGLEWSKIAYADNYQVRYSLSMGGPYTAIFDTLDTKIDAPRFLSDSYYTVAAQVGSTEIISNEVVVPALTIEAAMRAFQERHEVALESTYSWGGAFPRSSDGTIPPDYPADGFYDPDISGGNATRETELIQELSDLFFSTGILEQFAEIDTETLLEDTFAVTPIPYYQDPITYSRRPPFPLVPPTVSEGTRMDSLREIADWFCLLQVLAFRLIQEPMAIAGHGEFYFSEYDVKDSTLHVGDDCRELPTCRKLLSDGWDNPVNTWTATSSEPGYPFSGGSWAYTQYVYTPAGTRVCVGQLRSVRYKLWTPLNHGQGKAYLFQALTLDLGVSPKEIGQNPPCKVDGKFHQTESVSMDGIPFDFESNWYANMKPEFGENEIQFLWNLYSPMIVVVKKIDNDDWTEIP